MSPSSRVRAEICGNGSELVAPDAIADGKAQPARAKAGWRGLIAGIALWLMVPAFPQESGVRPYSADRPEGLIRLDVVVADQTGKPVSGLSQAEFKLLDNGQPAPIVSFDDFGATIPRSGAVSKAPVSDWFLFDTALLVIDTLGESPHSQATQDERFQVEKFLRLNKGRRTRL